MKPIIFARIADMKFYKGITDTDKPVNGGSYVKDTNYAHECYNFDPVILEDKKEYCLGFTQLLGGKDPQLHIEHIVGCKGMKDALSVDNVIVVFCSKAHNSKTMRVVGFYKNATVFRDYQECLFPSEDGNDYVQSYSFLAEKKDCVLLPYQERFRTGDWFVPTSGKMGYSFGYGHNNIWFAGSNTYNMDEINYVNKMIESIENYNGENMI